MGRKPGGKNRIKLGGESVSAQEVLQSVAFPIDEGNAAAVRLSEDADQKKEVAAAAAKIPQIFTEEQVIWIFDAYVAVLSFVYSVTLKTDFSAIKEELEFSQEQKEQFAKPLAKICSKYAPAEWAGMSAEIELCTLMGIWTVSSFQRAKNVAKRLEQEKEKANRTHPVQPMRRGPIYTHNETAAVAP